MWSFKKKSIEEKVESEEERIAREENEKYERKFNSLTLFPGDLVEYERFVGYECEIIDTGESEKFIEWSGRGKNNPFKYKTKEIQDKMYEADIEALIYYSGSYQPRNSGSVHNHIGVPVRKKTSK